MKNFFISLLLLLSISVQAQVYNNEWINTAKTYYKFKVAKATLHRISYAELSNVGIGNAAAEQFQLWRNGVEVPIFTTVATGAFSSTDYIEFWGELNDGKPDNELYRRPEYQLNNKYSLETDTAMYFLTLNSGNNKRLVNTANIITGNTVPAEPYFMYTIGNYFKNKINPGLALDVSDYLYSSSYDYGEGYSSTDVGTNITNSKSYTGLNVYTAGPNAQLKINVSGNSSLIRNYRVKINTDSILGNRIDAFNYSKDSATFPLSVISAGTANIQVTNLCANANDRIVIHQYELTYPRIFNFGNAVNFEFTLPASNAAKYFEIKGFSYSKIAPVLYDLNNGKRYVGNITTSGTVKFLLQPAEREQKLVLSSMAATNITNVIGLKERTFQNFFNSLYQGNYLIISNKLLYDGSNSINQVEEYRNYRNSAAGGAHKAVIYEIDDIVDQFGFGIKKNPAAVKNFIRFARKNFTEMPKFIFLIGKGVLYNNFRTNESNVNANTLNLIPTFGNPASDNLFTSEPGSSLPLLPIGRLSAVSAQEVELYLKKIKVYEAAQKMTSSNRDDKEWMKNIVHVVGASEPALQITLDNYFTQYNKIITDTLFGGKVKMFTKTSAGSVEQLVGADLEKLFKTGITLLTYFGHSSSSTLEFNLDNPQNYENEGKYPMFFALGCNAGSIFNFTAARLQARETISEKYVLAQDRGTIGLVASTHFGIPYYLNKWTTIAYKNLASNYYDKSIGELLTATSAQVLNSDSEEDIAVRANIEQTELHGDPAIYINAHKKPDYLIEESLVKVSPEFISVAEANFTLDAKFLNIGRSVNKPVNIKVTRTYPDGTLEVIYNKAIDGIRFTDSLLLKIPIKGTKDKGVNKITVTINPDNVVDELFFNNNTVTKEVLIYEDEVKPVYPFDLSIVNKDNVKLIVSTANALSKVRNYVLEMDTTKYFNSLSKFSKTISSVGGLIEIQPGITLQDGIVYYWRISIVPTDGDYHWNTTSFVYKKNSSEGFNQSHYFQHLKSEGDKISLDSLGKWTFDNVGRNFFIRNAIFPTGGSTEADFTVAVDGSPFIRSACVGKSLIFSVFDKNSLKPWVNVDSNNNNLFRYGSGAANCNFGRQNNFEFSFLTSASRKKMMDFMDTIPVGAYVIVRSVDHVNNSSFSSTWRGDTALYGSNKSLYHKLLEAGFTKIDSINSSRAWILVYQKGNNKFTPKYSFTQGIYDKATTSVNVSVPSSTGYLKSPLFGPALKWNEIQWEGKFYNNAANNTASLEVVGVGINGNTELLLGNILPNQKKIDISSIDASKYPYLQLRLTTVDNTTYTPYQLSGWSVNYKPVPEGAIAPNIYLSGKDTLNLGEPLDFKVAFKNVSTTAFDSLKIKMVITDQSNAQHVLPVIKLKPIAGIDTLHVRHLIDTKSLTGINTLYVEVNPDNDQLEQYQFNNFLYHKIFIKGDETNPVMDVTFDNVHILNNDLVSAKPDILIRIKDDITGQMLDDSSLVKVQVRYPDGALRAFNYKTDTLQFEPANSNSGEGNVASARFRPQFLEDGNYELIVTAKDKAGNKASNADYRVGFQVITKAMISNMLNYPNPFTTSTAFVFTLTGSEVPQNLKIQILTITGKIVREITKEELGNLKIGRNITDFKWDGTDQFGQKLGNGVYLYRVVTNLNGKTLEKYKSETDKTDQYFNKGYGKMYLMR